MKNPSPQIRILAHNLSIKTTLGQSLQNLRWQPQNHFSESRLKDWLNNCLPSLAWVPEMKKDNRPTKIRPNIWVFMFTWLPAQDWDRKSKVSCSFISLAALYSLDVLWGQPIKLVQVPSTSELLEIQRKDLVFFKIIPSHFCRASEASKIDCIKN